MKRTIAILGAGYSGTLTAVNILRQNLGNGIRVVLVERQSPIGRGLAYRTWDDNLLLNVPAGNMDALADDPGHFLSYCRKIDPHFNSGSFLPRRIYGDYLEDTLAQTASESSSVLEKITCEATAVRPGSPSGGFTVHLADGRMVLADQVVLALGHFLPTNPQITPDWFPTDAYVANPWDLAALDRIDSDRPVALLGAGHTAIDTLFRITSRGDGRKILLLSRRGLLPHGHRLTPRPPAEVDFPSYLAAASAGTVRAYLHAIRREAERRQAAGDNWRDVINELRHYTPQIWQRFPLAERRRFLDRVVPYWDIHRHRLAPSAYLRLRRLLDSGQVQAIAGHVLAYKKQGDAVAIVVRQRRDGVMRELNVGSVVNCTGPNYDISTLRIPLVAQLRDEGYLRQDPLKTGLEVDELYQVIDRHGQSVSNLFYLGPMLKAKYWEAIAVPELRVHSLRMARLMLAVDPCARRPA
jgi:uncharacterized NAD(P)/FAD-binding protein YdhS